VIRGVGTVVGGKAIVFIAIGAGGVIARERVKALFLEKNLIYLCGK
jgi:hypothetical protein